MSEIKIPPLPADLDTTKYHTRAEAKAWYDARAAHFAAKDAVRRQEEQKAIEARVVKTLSESEYEAQGLARYNAMLAREAERKAEEYAAEQEKLKALAASPEVAEVLATNPAQFLTEFSHWTRRGYEVDLNGPLVLGWNLSHITLKAPAPAKKAKAVAA